MPSGLAPERRPAHIPLGYSLSREMDGESAGGFHDDANQVALIYIRNMDDTDGIYPLIVYSAPNASPPLGGTEGRRGDFVDLGIAGRTAVYHDGLWAPGPGEGEELVDDVVIHWERADAHSLTISSPEGAYAVRGARSRGIDLTELIRVAVSI